MSSQSISGEDLPESAHPNHGRTRAAWVANIGIVIGAVLAGLGFTLWDTLWMAVGGGMIVAALVLGGILKAAGHGQPSR